MDLTGLGSVFDFAKGIIDRVWADPAQRAQATLELTKLQQSGELQKLALDTQLLQGQIDINKVEAASSSKFISWWRPSVGWVCGFSLAYVSIIDPISRFIALTNGYKGPFPVIDTSITLQVLLGLLGLAGMRSLEKIKGAEGNR
jgi:hypothetical protein